MKIMCNAAGITFRNGGEEFTTARPEGKCQFVRDPDNKFDPLAVEIHWGDLFIGYVKKDSYAQEWLNDHPEITEGNITGYSYSEGSGDNLTFNDDHRGRLGSLSFEIVSGENDVVMDEDNNYIIDGVPFMRLSNVAKHIDPEPDNPGLDSWKINHKDYKDYTDDLNGRARAGTAMHKAIEMFIERGEESDLIPDGYYNFIEKHDVKFRGTEILLFNDKDGIAGTCDANADVIDGPKKARVAKNVAIDWKSSKKPTRIHAIKTSWYAVELGCEEAWVVAFGGTNKQGYSLMKISGAKLHALHNVVKLTRQIVELLRMKS